jgi:50S ribosomal protein L16 3-hydroxylase
VNGLALPVDYETFLARYWQREPLFIPAGLPGFQPPLSADELAGIALDPAADARLVRQQGEDFSQCRAPLEESDLQQPGRWTLLVQEVDHFSDAAAELLGILPFLPRWRLNDVLMSYATDGGSAGPHFDRYDVFIVQGSGERLWRVGQRCDSDSRLRPGDELQILADFHTRDSFRMRCGDVLYLPPGVAHWGESIGESTSFSIGLRAPPLRDMLARWLDNRLETLDENLLFADPRREAAVHAGEITAHDLDRARQQLRALLDFDDPRWFGETITESGDDPAAGDGDDGLPAALLELAPGQRLAWLRQDADLLVFAAGQSRSFDPSLRPLLEALCSGEQLRREDDTRTAQARELLQWLLEQGTLHSYD